MMNEKKACANNYKMDRYSKNYIDHLSNFLSGINSICYALKYTELNDSESLCVADAFYLLESMTGYLSGELEQHLEHTTIIE